MYPVDLDDVIFDSFPYSEYHIIEYEYFKSVFGLRSPNSILFPWNSCYQEIFLSPWPVSQALLTVHESVPQAISAFK